MFESISKIKDIDFDPSADLSRYSTMRLRCHGPLAISKTIEATQQFVRAAKRNNISYRLLGWGANQLLVDQANFIYLHLEFDFDFDQLDKPSDRYHLPASLPLAKLTSHGARFSLSGWEVFTGIPASLGGAIYMNAGTNLGEIGEVVDKVGLIDVNGELREELITKNSFSYRHNKFCRPGEIIIWAELVHKGLDSTIKTRIRDYLKLRSDTQPLNKATIGCMYKNYENDGMTCRAGLSLDIMGLKGLSFGGVSVSHKHANFMENAGYATRNDVLKLTQLVQDELKLTLGIEFELEIDTGER